MLLMGFVFHLINIVYMQVNRLYVFVVINIIYCTY